MRLNYFMKLEDFNYQLPKNLIAQTPIKPRDQSRLLVLNREKAQITDKFFYNIAGYLRKGDVLVLNNSKVFPARLIGRKIPTGGKIEVFLLKKALPYPLLIRRGSPAGWGEGRGAGEVWQCLIGGKGRKEKLPIEFARGLKAEILKDNGDGTWLVKFNKRAGELMKVVNKIGLVPLPPYVKRKDGRKQTADSRNYQTVYANDGKVGSVAAPTAGFHFTKRLLKKLKSKGVEFEFVTLHVGPGTFAPVKVDNITKHRMHLEWAEVSADVIKRIFQAKSERRRIIAVGTTSVRTLESVFKNKRSLTSNLEVKLQRDYADWINLFIYPGYKFRIVDAMITNFHLPKSTLLMLMMAFAGRKNILKAYKSAIRKKYRFYSYGDAMFII